MILLSEFRMFAILIIVADIPIHAVELTGRSRVSRVEISSKKLNTDPLWTMYPHQEHKTDPKTTGNRLGAAPGCSSKIPDFPLFERCFPIRISPTFFFFGAGFHKVPDVGSSNGLAHSIRILILPRYSSPWDGFESGATSRKK